MNKEKTNVLVVVDSAIGVLGSEQTDKEYKDMTIVSIDGYEGRFIITKPFTMEHENNVFNAHRIPEETNEEQFLIKYKEQLEKATPVTRWKKKQINKNNEESTVILSCTEAGKELNMNKSEVLELVANQTLENYGNSHRAMVHADDLKGYIKLLNNEITSHDFKELKAQTRSSYLAIFSNRFEHMKKRKSINTTKKYIEENEPVKKPKITYLELEYEIFRAKEELEERIFEAREKNPPNEKAIFQYQCEIRGIEKVLEILDLQRDGREVL